MLLILVARTHDGRRQRARRACNVLTLGLFLRLERLPLALELLRLRQQKLNDALLAVHVTRRRRHGLHRRVDAQTAMPEGRLRVAP